MNAGEGDFSVRHILVAVDAAVNSSAVLETAARLARSFNAELNGIFVEDLNLLRLAGLPFARELTWSTAMELRMDYQRMERTLRGHAAYARQAVVNVTTRLQLHASLQIVRGQVVHELLRAAENADLFVLGKGGKLRGARMGAIARQVAQQAHCSVLLVQEDTQFQGRVMIHFTGTDRSEKLLNAAARVASADETPLLVLVPAVSPADFEHLSKRCRQLLAQASSPVSYRRTTGTPIDLNQRILREEGVGTLVVDARSDPDKLVNQMARLECSALLVR